MKPERTSPVLLTKLLKIRPQKDYAPWFEALVRIMETDQFPLEVRTRFQALSELVAPK